MSYEYEQTYAFAYRLIACNTRNEGGGSSQEIITNLAVNLSIRVRA